MIVAIADQLSLLKKNYIDARFPANAENLKAIPFNSDDQVDLNDQKISIPELKIKIKDLVYNKDYVSACDFAMEETILLKKLKQLNRQKTSTLY